MTMKEALPTNILSDNSITFPSFVLFIFLFNYPLCCPALLVVQNYVSMMHNEDKVIVFERSDVLVFVFNFHPCKSYTDYKIGVKTPGMYPWSQLNRLIWFRSFLVFNVTLDRTYGQLLYCSFSLYVIAVVFVFNSQLFLVLGIIFCFRFIFRN